jgi:hypothetical protein
MRAVWMRFRAELRTRWTATLALVLLVGLAGAVVLAAAAGARRTGSAYDRLVEESRAWDVLVNPDLGNESALDPEEVARLPQVESFAYIPAMLVGRSDAESLEELFEAPIALAGPDGAAFYEIGRPNLLEGRMPDPSQPDEILVDRLTADQYNLEPGDVLPGLVLLTEELEQLENEEDGFERYRRGELGEPVDLTVTGTGIAHADLVVDEGFELPTMVVTPAFYRRHPDALAGFWGGMGRLERGAADERAFRKAVEAMVPGETIEFQSSARIEETVDRAVRPYVVSLQVFALVVALTAILVIGQALARQRFVDAVDDPPLRALGLTRAELVTVATLRTAIVALAGAVVAPALAWATSPLMPIGPARPAEPDRGLSFDTLTLLLGSASIVVLVMVLGVLPAWRLLRARRVITGAAPPGTGRPSVVAGSLARAGWSPAATAGVRLALEPGRGHASVPTRTTLLGAAVAVGTVVAALTFGAGLDRLLVTPRLFGVNWDARVGFDPEAREAVAEALRADESVVGSARVAISRVELDHRSVPAVGFEPVEGEVLPTLVSGRAPERAREVALGADTMARLGVDVGDRLTARFGDLTRSLDVVGTVVLPGAGNYPGGDKTALSSGALLTRGGLAPLAPDFGVGTFLVRFGDGVDTAAARARLRERLARLSGPDFVEVAGIEQPADVVDLERVRATPVVLAGMLAALGVAAVAHALVATVRRRRRDLALLKTLGFTRPQVSATVAWQASTVAVVALLVGIPLGIAAGRWAWTLLAEEIGAIAEPATPLLVVLLAVPVALLVTNLVAAAPAWLAGRTRPGTVLRAE